MGMFSLSTIEPVQSVELKYENAYGGCYVDKNGNRIAWPENPIGKGFVDPRNKESVDAPQVFLNREEAATLSYGRQCVTAGFGPCLLYTSPSPRD